MKTIIYGICAVVGSLWITNEAEAARFSGTEHPETPGSGQATPAATTDSTQPDSTTLLRWRQAALAGDAAACKALGNVCADASEQLMPRNLRAALNWYLEAARKGDAEAQRLAGATWLMLNDELEEPRPIEVAAARYWLGRAATQGDAEARTRLNELTAKTTDQPSAPQSGKAECTTDTPTTTPADTPAAAPTDAPAPAGRTQAWPARPDDYARLLNAFDTAAAHGTRLMTPQDPKLSVVVNRSRFEALRDRILSGDDYGAPTYRAALDSLQAHHLIRTFEDMGMDYMLFKVKLYYDTLPVDWSPARQTDSSRYEMTDRGTRFEYVVEQSGPRWRVYRKASGDFSDPESR